MWMDPDSQKDFWEFTFEDIANYDLPASIEFIEKEKNDTRKITLLGYSQGTTVISFGLASKPEYFDQKVKLFVALAPTILFKSSLEPGLKALADQKWIMDLLLQLNYLEFQGKNRNTDSDFVAYVKATNPLFCTVYEEICNFGKINEETMVASPSISIERMDRDRLEIYIKVRGGTSTKNMIQMAQQYQADRLTYFDYGD